MKRFIIYIFMLMLVPMTSMAQSMSDAQVAQYIAKEHAMGTSNTQIVTKLIQKGVNIKQIRRVRKQYEKMQNESSLGSNTSVQPDKSHRLRVNNGNTRDDYGKGVNQYQDVRGKIFGPGYEMFILAFFIGLYYDQTKLAYLRMGQQGGTTRTY
jgi:hypothetical protein